MESASRQAIAATNIVQPASIKNVSELLEWLKKSDDKLLHWSIYSTGSSRGMYFLYIGGAMVTVNRKAADAAIAASAASAPCTRLVTSKAKRFCPARW